MVLGELWPLHICLSVYAIGYTHFYSGTHHTNAGLEEVISIELYSNDPGFGVLSIHYADTVIRSPSKLTALRLLG